MSTDSVKQIIARAATDPYFKKLLVSKIEDAIQGYELTSDEIEALKNIHQDDFEAMGGELEERISRTVTKPSTEKCLACYTVKWTGSCR